MLHENIGLPAPEVTEKVYSSPSLSKTPTDHDTDHHENEQHTELHASLSHDAHLDDHLDQRHPEDHLESEGDAHFHAVRSVAPGSPPSEINESHEDEAEFETFQASSGWSRTATNGGSIRSGQAVTLTWSIAAEGTFIPGFAGEAAADSNLQAFLNDVYDNGNGVNDEKDIWLPIIASAFDRWSELGGVNFVFESEDDGQEFSNFTNVNPGVLGTRGDIRLGGHAIDGDFNTLGYNFSPNVGEMILDTSDNAFARNRNNPVWLRNLVAHELGHALGLSHVVSSDANFLLEPSISTEFDGPQLDDILGLHRIYGDALESANGIPSENNDSITTATTLGLLQGGASLSRGSDAVDGTTVITGSQTDFVSIDDESDIDVFRFTVDVPTAVNISLDPRGATYSQRGQSLNTKAFSDLSLALLDSQGNVLASANNTAEGGSENISGFQLDSAGDYFIRVTGANDNVQLYELNVSAPGVVLTGNGGADSLIGGNGNDTILGNGGSDRLFGSLGADSIDGGAGNDFIRGSQGADTLLGGLGTDIVDYFGSTVGINVNLAIVSATGGDAQGDILSGFERVYGSNVADRITGDNLANLLWGRSGNDTLNGGAGNDILRGGLGADLLDGGTGLDVADYIGSVSGVSVNLLTGDNQNGEAAGDILLNFERIYGSNLNDQITGDNLANLLWGRSGNDTINGASGNDVIRGGLGRDVLDGGSGTDILDYTTATTGISVDLLTGTGSVGEATGDIISNFERVYGSNHHDQIGGDNLANFLWGRSGNDTIEGGAGNDIIRGGTGADRLDGGTGIDVVDYITSTLGVSVNLLTGDNRNGEAAGDILLDFESVYGSNLNDQITGDDLANRLWGRSGRDTIEGGAGRDIIRGGLGGDVLDGGSGTDTLDYTRSNASVSVDLETGSVSGGEAAGDTITNFERVYGSNQADQIQGDSQANVLQGRSGSDTLAGAAGNDILRGGTGADRLDGGDGFDVLDYSDSRNGVIVDLERGTARGGDAQGDAIANFESVNGSNANDHLIGDITDNNLSGRNGNDTLIGGMGRDTLLGGGGRDTFELRSFEESVLLSRDWIRDFEIGVDLIVGLTAVTANDVAQLGSVTALNAAGLRSFLTSETFGANGAATFTRGSRTYLALNDAVDGYQSTNDSLIELTGYRGNLSALSIG